MRPDDATRRGLEMYLDAVARVVGVDADRCVFHVGGSAAAFLPLTRQIPWLADRRFVMLWDEEDGWAATVTSRDGAMLVPVSFLGRDVLADASVVGWFAGELACGEYVGCPFPPRLRRANAPDGLDRRLAAFSGR